MYINMPICIYIYVCIHTRTQGQLRIGIVTMTVTSITLCMDLYARCLTVNSQCKDTHQIDVIKFETMKIYEC